ncbi:hypothetical protein ASD22_08020 [Rhodanobacter sp. Root480]|nr:hypothetical protein ASD22_08020 [Rhodanobacter sp. Root480]
MGIFIETPCEMMIILERGFVTGMRLKLRLTSRWTELDSAHPSWWVMLLDLRKLIILEKAIFPNR